MTVILCISSTLMHSEVFFGPVVIALPQHLLQDICSYLFGFLSLDSPVQVFVIRPVGVYFGFSYLVTTVMPMQSSLYPSMKCTQPCYYKSIIYIHDVTCTCLWFIMQHNKKPATMSVLVSCHLGVKLYHKFLHLPIQHLNSPY